VEVEVGGGVLEGNGVCVGISVDTGCVMEGVKIDNVGVSVAALEGRLQASMARTRVSTNKKLRDFIAILLYFCSILPNEHITDNRPFGVIYLLFFLRSSPRKFSILRMNLYSGGPNRNAIRINMKNSSLQPIAITGSQASVLMRSATHPLKNFLFMDYFSIGILIP
jgi:hypothetical protein